MSNVQQKTDYIIVGQGLAGACLAIHLLQRNKRVIVFDQPHNNHASSVAAGLFNPFTGKLSARTWMADALFPYLFEFYRTAEKFLESSFFHPRDLYRPFLSIQEQNEWMGKSATPEYGKYIREILLSPTVQYVNDPLGGLRLQHAGFVDVPAFQSAVKRHLIEKHAWIEEHFVYEDVVAENSGVTYQNISAKGVIFCEGMGIRSNPFFSWLPVNPLKGETLQINMPFIDYIVNRGVYIVSAGTEGSYNVGATYDFTTEEPGITQRGRDELELKLSSIVTTEYEVTGQQWGIRPTSLDQKVMIGAHPKWGNLFVFNGLGTKGVSQGPYFAGQLAGYLTGGNEILGAVNIQRYKALYSKSQVS